MEYDDDDDPDYEVFEFNHRVELIDGEPFLIIDLADGNALMFSPENWMAFIGEGIDALFAAGMQNAPASKRMQ